MKDIVLVTAVWVREVDGNLHRLAWPDLKGVHHAQILRQQAADSPASAVGTEEMAHALQRTMRTVLRSSS